MVRKYSLFRWYDRLYREYPVFIENLHSSYLSVESTHRLHRLYESVPLHVRKESSRSHFISTHNLYVSTQMLCLTDSLQGHQDVYA